MRTLTHVLFALLLVSCGETEDNPHHAANDGNGAAGAAVDETSGGAEAVGGRVNAVGGADSAPDSGGVGGQSVPDVVDPLESSGPNAAVCDAYLAAWQLRSVQQSGDAGLCYQCLGNQPACFEAAEAITAGQQSCFLRHCLCDPVREDCAAFDYPTDVCACFASCLPVPPHPARQKWIDYMTCDVESCADACR